MQKKITYYSFTHLKWIFLFVLNSLAICVCSQNLKENDSIEVILKTSHDTATVNLLNKLSSDNLRTNPEQAKKYAEQALVLSNKLNFKKGSATSLRNIGAFYTQQGNYPEAIDYLEQSLKLFENINWKRGVAFVLDDISRVHQDQGSYDSAMENELKSLNLYRELNDEEKTAAILNNIASIYRDKGEYEMASNYYFEALKIEEALNKNYEIAIILQNIGNIYYFQNNLEKAIDYYQKSLKIQEELGDKTGIADNFNNIGGIYYQKKSLDKAIEYYQRALKLYQELGSKKGIASSYSNIGSIYTDLKKYTEAKQYIENALNIYKELNNQDGLSITYGNLGNMYLNSRSYSQALNYFNESITIAKKIGSKEGMYYNYFNLSETYKGLKDYKKAFEYYQQYNQLKDSVLNTENIAKINELEKKYATEKKQKEIDRLSKEKEIQAVLLDKQNFQIIALLVLVVSIMLLGFLLYNRNKLKQKVLLHNETVAKQELVLKTTILVQEEERKKIAKDLHDNIGYLLTGLKLSLEKVEKDVSLVFPPSKQSFEKISKLLDNTYSEIRSISNQMALPIALDKKGLIAAMEEMLNNTVPKTEIAFEFEHFKIEKRFPEEIEIAIYRITQELVNNIIKHSYSNSFTVQLIKIDTNIMLLVEDNGKGFDINKDYKGLGLSNIQSRTDLVKGELNISSTLGKGTVVTVKIPLT